MFFNNCASVTGLRARVIGAFAVFAVLFAASAALQAQTATVNDGHGKEWMQLTATRGRSWAQVAQSCPQDGTTPCAAPYHEWVWASDAQVLELMSYYEPAMATNRAVGGMQYFFTAEIFFGSFQPTFSFCGTYQCGAYGAGWTATRDANGFPIYGAVSHGSTPVSIDGSFGVYPAASVDETDSFRGVWLWRATGPGVVAYDDAGTVATPNGGTAVANVLANDWIAGVRATTANIFLTQVSSTNAGVTLDTADGSVDARSGTPAGNYSLVYRICDSTNASNCDDATVSVRVNPFVVDAVNDAGWASPSGGIAVANVLSNDRLSTTTLATTANVALSLVSTDNSGVTLNTSNGAVGVAAGTALGAYSLVYRICDRTNLANCDTATVAVTVRHNTIDAVNDYVRATSKVANNSILNVLTNDTLNGVRVTSSNVRISQVSPAIQGISLNTSTGAISTSTKSSSGLYYITYQICETAAPTNCDTAIATVELSGRDR